MSWTWTLCSAGYEAPRLPSVELWRGPLRWITSARHAPHRQDPLPLALAAQDCSWRDATLNALEQAGRRWRVAYSSATLAGTIAPVLAGLAVSVATDAWLPEGLRVMRPDEGLPELPDTGIMLENLRGPATRNRCAGRPHHRDVSPGNPQAGPGGGLNAQSNLAAGKQGRMFFLKKEPKTFIHLLTRFGSA